MGGNTKPYFRFSEVRLSVSFYVSLTFASVLLSAQNTPSHFFFFFFFFFFYFLFASPKHAVSDLEKKKKNPLEHGLEE